ncbi:MAG: hypothetical protein M0Q19_01400 [Candidatus Cloacimonetes bacterium]|nr:hypothetical protein [Candidatus Cloacimonadota bacterium]
MRKIIICLMLMTIVSSVFAQNAEDWLWENETPKEEELKADFIQVNYEKKNARTAMVMSMLFPGAGQFYADRSAFTTYLFPVLEAGMIAGIVYFNKRGDDKTKDYEYYANGELIDYTLPNGEVIQNTFRYSRERQERVETLLLNLNSADIYEQSYFRLDDNNTQHFYEDIGKYAHYVFGWADWYYTFATDESGSDQDPNWSPSGYDTDPPNPNWTWSGNYPLYDVPERDLYMDHEVRNDSHDFSIMRRKYIEMRNEAKSDYAISRAFTFGLAFNHIAAGLDAIRLTRKVNRGAITDRGIRMQYYTRLRNDKLTPTLSFNWKF